MPLFYFSVVDNVNVEMMERELKEVADYVSNSLGNLYLLANSTNCEVLLEKRLDLPSSIRDSTYFVEIVRNQSDRSAQYVKAYSKDRSGISADSWILPGPKADNEKRVIESGEKIVIAGCSSNSTGTYVWIKEEQ